MLPASLTQLSRKKGLCPLAPRHVTLLGTAVPHCSRLTYLIRFRAHLVPLKGLLGLERVLRSWRRGLSYWLEKGPMVEKGPKSWVTSAREKAGLWLPISSALSFRFRDLVEALIRPSRWWGFSFLGSDLLCECTSNWERQAQESKYQKSVCKKDYVKVLIPKLLMFLSLPTGKIWLEEWEERPQSCILRVWRHSRSPDCVTRLVWKLKFVIKERTGYKIINKM